jgi:hypothetical protein
MNSNIIHNGMGSVITPSKLYLWQTVQEKDSAYVRRSLRVRGEGRRICSN